MTDLIKAPRLEEANTEAIRIFLPAFLSYRSSGRKHVLELINPSTWDFIKVKLEIRGFAREDLQRVETREERTEELCLNLLRAACCPAKVQEQMHHFDDTYLESATEDAAFAFVRSFCIRQQELAAGKSIWAQNEQFLIETFSLHISIPLLQQLFLQGKPTWNDAPRHLLEAVLFMTAKKDHDKRRQQLDQPRKSVGAPKPAAPKTGGPIKSCPRHPQSTSHSWSECSLNPKNGGAAIPKQSHFAQGGSNASAHRSSPSAAGATPMASASAAIATPAAQNNQFHRNSAGRLTRGQMLKAVASNDDDVALPRHLSVTVHTPEGQQRHVGFSDTGSDLCVINTIVARRMKERGCKSVPPPPGDLLLLNGKVAHVAEALELDVSISTPASGKELRTKAVFIVLDCVDDFVIGYPLINEMVRKGYWWTAPPSSESTLQETPSPLDDEDDLVPPVSSASQLKVVFADDPIAREKMTAMLDKYSHLFRIQTPTDVIDMEPVQVTLLKQPPKQHPRKIPRAHADTVKKMIDEWVDMGIAAPSSSPHCNPLVLIKKREGESAVTTADTHRLCLDLRCLNSCLQSDSFPLPNMQTLLDIVSGHRVFAVLDVRSAFLQVPLHPATSALLAFTAADGHYEMRRLPFGLKMAPSILQRLMTEILAGLVGIVCCIYMDDCCIFADSADELIFRVEQVLMRFQRRQVLLKASKCIFGVPEIPYLGHIVSAAGLAMDPARTSAFVAVPVPKNKDAVVSFLGAANWFRRFIPRFSMIAEPLYKITHKDQPYHWGEEQESAFNKIKEAVVESVTLSTFLDDRETVLRTDACNYGIAGMLLQVEDQKEFPIGFFSRALRGPELLYSTVEQEALGIISAVQHFDYYLLGRHFIIETDSKNNTFIQTANNAKVARWRLLMQNYDYEVRHLPGSANVVSDYLSRAFALTYRDRIAAVHSAVAGHLGVNETLRRLEETGFTEPNMRQQVVNYIQQCGVCAKTRRVPPPLPAVARSVEVWEPFESLSIDFVGPFPPDGDGHTYIVCIIDNFSRFVELSAHKDATAFSAAQAMLSVFARYGAPLEVRSDHGPHFAAEAIRQFLALCDIRQRFSLPYRPQANGIVERAIQECNRHLRALVVEQHILNNWSASLPLVQRIMNGTVHSATGVPPAVLVYGGMCNVNRNLFSVPTGDLANKELPQYIIELVESQQQLIERAQRRQAAVIDDRLGNVAADIAVTFDVGDSVLLRPPHDRPQGKLFPRLLGPYIIVSKTGTNTYTIRPASEEAADPSEVHVDRLVACPEKDDAEAADLLAADDAQEYLVESILRHRRLRPGNRPSCFEYEVKWVDYEDTTWEPSSSFLNNSIFKTYLATHRIGVTTGRR